MILANICSRRLCLQSVPKFYVLAYFVRIYFSIEKKKDLGVPNSLPFKEAVLKEAEDRKRKVSRPLDYSKTCFKRPLKKKTKIGFQSLLLLNAGQKYCRMLQESILQ